MPRPVTKVAVRLRHEAERAMVREYKAGYRRKPENRREIRAAEAAAVRLFAVGL